MEDQEHLPKSEALVNNKPRKKKPPSQNHEILQSPGNNIKKPLETRKGAKASKRGQINEGPRLVPDTVADSSTSGNEYRALRRKYLLLEEESFGLGRELKEVEDDVKALEDEKLSLLDELVVLEGLIDPADLQPQGQRLQ